MRTLVRFISADMINACRVAALAWSLLAASYLAHFWTHASPAVTVASLLLVLIVAFTLKLGFFALIYFLNARDFDVAYAKLTNRPITPPKID
jgi:hypothetical protein